MPRSLYPYMNKNCWVGYTLLFVFLETWIYENLAIFAKSSIINHTFYRLNTSKLQIAYLPGY